MEWRSPRSTLRGSLRYVQVTVAEWDPGAGVAFRYEDPSNYWSLLAVPLDR